MNRRIFVSALLASGLAVSAASAQQAAPTRVRGTIAALTGNMLTVKARNGETVDIALGDPLTVMTVKNVPLSSVAVGSFIGTTTRTGADGKQTAIEVHVFPEAMRGTGEGNFAWDLEPGSQMTNGTVKGEVTAANGRELSMGFKDAGNTVVLPPGIPIVMFEKASKDDVKPGAPVFVIATKGADGKLSAARLTVGTNGVAPPM